MRLYPHILGKDIIYNEMSPVAIRIYEGAVIQFKKDGERTIDQHVMSLAAHRHGLKRLDEYYSGLYKHEE